MEPILTVDDLQKTYGGRGSRTKALRGLSLRVFPGEFVGIMGPSGSGKTTLLNCVSTIDSPTAGSIRVDGTELTAMKGRALSKFRRERLGFIFQDCNLLDTLTGLENIALALTIGGAEARSVESRAREAARLLGVEDVLDRFPYQMSGGQQQRVAAARAIVNRPALILADEPTGALDSKSTRMLLEQLEGLNREEGATILLVTHDAFTASWCRRILFLRDGELYRELRREDKGRKEFFREILSVVSELGGDGSDVL
ncbi:MAG: ABC transporter ATP-binding protein [Oscillospiraceae bacterium]|nr:ABC transporter ATP-binding protein [Oscillospiraceae bacterium]